MAVLQNDCLLRALRQEPVDRTPIWLMRQAGRYMAEYRAVRKQAGSFMSLCTNPELACEVTMQPLDRFRLDAAILFSDILTIPDAMGLGLYFAEGEGPKFERPVRTEADVRKLAVPDPASELKYVIDAVSLIRRDLNGWVPLIGFAGSPWTLATYMIEGGSSRDFRTAKKMMYDSPALLHSLLEKLADAITVYLNAQIEAGAQAVMLFDTWGGALSTGGYQEFSLKYAERIVNGLNLEGDEKVPAILFTKGGGQWLGAMADSGYDALGVDWTTDLNIAKNIVGNKVALQGNLDPTLLYASPDVIRNKVKEILGQYGDSGTGHVFNLGHGILPDIDPEHVEVLIEAVHEFSPAYHK